MNRFAPLVVLVASCATIAPRASAAAESAEAVELIRAGRFAREADQAAGAPGGSGAWAVWTPEVEANACAVRWTDEGLRVEAPGRPWAVGGVYQDVAGIAPGKAYAVEVDGDCEGIESPMRSVLVRVLWTARGNPLHPAGVYARLADDASLAGDASPRADGAPAVRFRDVLVAPEGADGARVSLEVKWPRGGAVVFRRASLTACDPPPPRKVKIGTVYLRPRNSTPERNMELFLAKIDEAGRLGLDIVCLPEAMLQVGTRATAAALAEPIPGPSTERLGRSARENRLWVVAGLSERDGETVYNTAVLIDRQGRLAGKYRKTHLPREEWQKGVAPGEDYPVFRTDFGTVAIQICYDWFFPEVHRLLALRGAEIIFAPTWGTTFPDRDGRAEGETVFRVRARDNGVYLVPSVYDGSSMVIDPLGRILAKSDGEGVFWAEVDLNRREPLWWVGQWGAIGPRDRMPETYGPLTAPAQPPRGASDPSADRSSGG